MRAALLTIGSLVLTVTVIGNAYYQKNQFYPSVVYITKSNPSMAVIYLQAFVLVLLMGKLMRKVFFGQLRAAEMEHLIERSWYAVTETCLAFTVFRDDFSPKFVALFTLLLFLKCFHWLAEDRVDYMERSPVISWLFHIRVISLLSLLGALDYAFVSHAYHSTLTKGPSVQLVFGFEYAILFSIVINIFIKYILHSIDLQSENPWENKAVYLLYCELLMGSVKVILYITFMAIMIKIHTFPLFAIRPMYLSMRAFKKAVNDVILSRRAIRNMNTLYPDATPEELATVDNVCIICREEMTGGGSSKKLPCNHIFHATCLRSWFQRQQTCPTCRMDVLSVATPNSTNVPNANVPPVPQEQPQPPPPQPPPFMNWPGTMPFPFWLPQQNQQQQQQQQSAAAGGSAEATPSASGSTTTTASGSNQPSFVPPFPFLPFFIPPPPPAPATDLRRLSLEELQNMEGHERENVEARIQCLRNIQTLLDAAVMQMQQYSTLVASMRSKEPNTAKTSHSDKAEASSNKDNVASTSEIPEPSDDPQAELRRRRLQRFTQSSHNIPDQTSTENDNNQTENEYSRHSD